VGEGARELSRELQQGPHRKLEARALLLLCSSASSGSVPLRALKRRPRKAGTTPPRPPPHCRGFHYIFPPSGCPPRRLPRGPPEPAGLDYIIRITRTSTSTITDRGKSMSVRRTTYDVQRTTYYFDEQGERGYNVLACIMIRKCIGHHSCLFYTARLSFLLFRPDSSRESSEKVKTRARIQGGL
jgi:hypothetical protein